MHIFRAGVVFSSLWIGHKTFNPVPLDDRCVVVVRGQNTRRTGRVAGADHVEQGGVLRLAVNDPAGIENLVAAVFGVGLREHHQFDIVGVAAQCCKAVQQVVDLVIRQRKSQLNIGPLKRHSSSAQDVHADQRCGFGLAENQLRVLAIIQYRFGHAVVQQWQDDVARCRIQPGALRQGQIETDAALDTPQPDQPTVVRDVGGLARPGGDSANARDDPQRYLIGCLRLTGDRF